MSKFPEPDYDFWDRETSFNELEVICLWAELEPSQEASQSHKAQVIKRHLEYARKEDLLCPDEEKSLGANGKLDYQLRYWRKDLIAYAEWNGEKPAFLFYDTRIVPNTDVLQNNVSNVPDPGTSVANTKMGDEPDTKPASPKDDHESGLTLLEKKIRVIEEFADTLGYSRTAIPIGAKKKLMYKCMDERSDLFGIKKHPFIEAWKQASLADRIIIVNRDKYKPR